VSALFEALHNALSAEDFDCVLLISSRCVLIKVQDGVHHAVDLQAHSCTHAFLWTWQRETWPAKDMGPQPVPHLVPSKFLLYVLNGLLSCTAVLMQPLWLVGDIPTPQQPFERPGAGGDTVNPLPVTLVPLPLQSQRSKSCPDSMFCAGVFHQCTPPYT
jgi:hypothetical protein